MIKLFDALPADFRRSTLHLLPPQQQHSEIALRQWASNLRRHYAGSDLVIVRQEGYLLGLPMRRSLSLSERLAAMDWLQDEPTFALIRADDGPLSLPGLIRTGAEVQGGGHDQ
jgi:hypothetical protein